MPALDTHLDIAFSFLSLAHWGVEEDLERLPRTDVIFLFGCRDTRLAQHAARLFRVGKAPRVVVTGRGSPEGLPAGYESEAAFQADALERAHVPPEALICEDCSMNTGENVAFGMETCASVDVRPRTLILCAFPFLCRRASATFARLYPSVTTFASTFTMGGEECAHPTHLGRILGEFDRFTSYAARGWIAPVVVPREVQEAVEAIRAHLAGQ